jgi:hypothetical protein
VGYEVVRSAHRLRRTGRRACLWSAANPSVELFPNRLSSEENDSGPQRLQRVLVVRVIFGNDSGPRAKWWVRLRKQKDQRVRFTHQGRACGCFWHAWGSDGDVRKSADAGPLPRWTLYALRDQHTRSGHRGPNETLAARHSFEGGIGASGTKIHLAPNGVAVTRLSSSAEAARVGKGMIEDNCFAAAPMGSAGLLFCRQVPWCPMGGRWDILHRNRSGLAVAWRASMTKEEFELLFDAEVAGPLDRRGFKRAGKNLYATENLASVSLIRLGGRMARPGAIAHLLCCRLSFMRDLTERVPDGFVPSPFAYPFKLLPSQLPPSPPYVPRNLNYQPEVIAFQGRDRDAIRQELGQISSLILVRLLPWAGALTATAVEEQLQTFGENAWCERMWIEDCKNHNA